MSEEGCIDFGYFLFNYGRFHNNKVNKLIHFIFIPIITVSGGALVSYKLPWIEFESGVPLIGKYLDQQHLSALCIFFTLIALVYTIVDPLIGVL